MEERCLVGQKIRCLIEACGCQMTVWSYRPLVELHLPVSEVRKLLEGIDRDQNWADVGLGGGTGSRTRTSNQTLAITATVSLETE